MFSSHSLFKVFGIPIRVHGTLVAFLLLAGIFLNPSGTLTGFLGVVGFAVAAFGFVLLHELGHCLAALYHGIRTHDITLTPIGGVAKMASMPREPAKEFQIAIAGPAVNFVFALLLWPLTLALPAGFLPIFRGMGFVDALVVINLCLGIFNLLPGFPMDGGRILRAALATRLPYLRATHIAVRVGQVVAVLLAFAGIFALEQPMLVVIAFFVFLSAQTELTMTRMRENPAAQGLEQLLKVFLGRSTGRQPTSGGGGGAGAGGGAAPRPSQDAGKADTDSDDAAPRADIIDIDEDGKIRRVWRR